jgi:hypothetical protein
MSEKSVSGTYEYHWLNKVGFNVGYLFVLFLSIAFSFAEGIEALLLMLVTGLIWIVMLPLAIRYNTFAMTIHDDEVRISSFRKKKVIAVGDIVDIRSRFFQYIEAVYVRDRLGQKFSFDSNLQNFESIKQYLLERSVLGRRQEDERKALGAHRYHKLYKIVLTIVVPAIWFGAIHVFPLSVFEGDFEIETLSHAFPFVLLLVFGILGVFLMVQDLPLTIWVDEQGVRSKTLGSTRQISFDNFETVRVKTFATAEDVKIVGVSGTKIEFHGLLEDFAHIKRFLVRRHQAGKAIDVRYEMS